VSDVAADPVGGALAIAAERLGEHARAVLSRLGGQLGHEARAAHAGLASSDRTERRQTRAAIKVATRSPVPAVLRTVHSTWIEAVLGELGERARTAVAAPTADAVDVWLARWATAALPPAMSAALLPPIAEANDASVVIAWLGRIGADQMAFALGDQAKAVPALAPAIARIGKPPRAGELGPQRAAIARCRDVSLDDDFSFVIVACRALAPHLAANQLARMQLILRLPRPVGLVVARELAAHAATSFDQCPSWSALDAR